MHGQDYAEETFGVPAAAHSREAVGFLNVVYFWMFIGLAATSVVSWMTLNTESLFMFTAANFRLLLIGELVLVFGLNLLVQRISALAATALFLLYSVMNGLTLSIIIALYTGESVTMAFVSASCLFGTMGLYGYFTRRDLSKLGNILSIALIALVVSMLINMLFLRSGGFSMLISAIGVVVFTGLTAYDTQKILRTGQHIADAGSGIQKAAVMGALILYLDFINLFLHMLRIFGKRK